jgi:hypothetical protein
MTTMSMSRTLSWMKGRQEGEGVAGEAGVALGMRRRILGGWTTSWDEKRYCKSDFLESTSKSSTSCGGGDEERGWRRRVNFVRTGCASGAGSRVMRSMQRCRRARKAYYLVISVFLLNSRDYGDSVVIGTLFTSIMFDSERFWRAGQRLIRWLWFFLCQGSVLDGPDASNLLHQTRCTTYDQLQYNSKEMSFLRFPIPLTLGWGWGGI